MSDAEASREANDLWFGAPEWIDRDEPEAEETEPELDATPTSSYNRYDRSPAPNERT
jgi:hypothetical protein